MDYEGRYTGPEIDERLEAAGTAYQKPEGGIPKEDLTEELQQTINNADSQILYVVESLVANEHNAAVYTQLKSQIFPPSEEMKNIVYVSTRFHRALVAYMMDAPDGIYLRYFDAMGVWTDKLLQANGSFHS